MSELVELVDGAIRTAFLSTYQPSMGEHVARAAIAAMFDWMGVPSTEALDAAFDSMDYDDSGSDKAESNNRAIAKRVGLAMLSTMRREALGDQL